MVRAEEEFVLTVRGLRKGFSGTEVLHGVDFDVVGGQILALLGENGAGKSTSVKILAGEYRRDDGEIAINRTPLQLRTPREAEAAGIRIIHQEFSDAPELSVAENVMLGRLPRRFGMVDWKAVHDHARQVLSQLSVHLPLDQPVSELGVAQRQIVEIARAIASEARVLVFDEPTSALAAEEVDSLFAFARKLRDRGVAIVYITHRLDEVQEIADRLVVFRDGNVVASGEVADFAPEAIVEAMVGERLETTLESLEKRSSAEAGPVALEVRGAAIKGIVEEVSFDVRAGEIVSLFGRLGCGALEVIEAIFGQRKLDAGNVRIGGMTGVPRSPSDAIGRGLGLVPLDRKLEGLLPGLSVGENISVANWTKLSRAGWLSPRAGSAAFARWQGPLKIGAHGGASQVIDTLSGGNQQKVIVGRWLEREVKVLLLAEPTRGVDVGARAEIYRVLTGLAGRGVAILVVSSDIEEVLRISDRIIVLSRGRVGAGLERKDADRASLTRAAAMKVGTV